MPVELERSGEVARTPWQRSASGYPRYGMVRYP